MRIQTGVLALFLAASMISSAFAEELECTFSWMHELGLRVKVNSGFIISGLAGERACPLSATMDLSQLQEGTFRQGLNPEVTEEAAEISMKADRYVIRYFQLVDSGVHYMDPQNGNFLECILSAPETSHFLAAQLLCPKIDVPNPQPREMPEPQPPAAPEQKPPKKK